MSSAALTILLPLKDRAIYTRRWLAYAARVAMPARIVLADGGSDDAGERLADAYREQGLDIEYVRYPFDSSYADYYRKIADALSRVTTPFVAMADNDDFFIAPALTRAVEFLAAHPDYTACGGQSALFWMSATGDANAGGDGVTWKCSSQFASDSADGAGARLRGRCLGANDVFYAVHRTEALRAHFAAVRDCNFSDLFLMEELVMFLTAIAGKTQQLDTLYIARQQDSPGSSAGTHESQFGNWFDRMLQPTWSEDFARFVACASAALAAADRLPLEQARQVVIESYKVSVAPFLLSDVMREPSVSFSTPIVQQIVRRLVNLPRTSQVRRTLQRLYRRAQWVSHDFVHGTEWVTGRSRQAAREFSPVREFLAEGGAHSSRTSGT